MRVARRGLRALLAVGVVAVAAGAMTGAVLELAPPPQVASAPTSSDDGRVAVSARSDRSGLVQDPVPDPVLDPVLDRSTPAEAAAALTQRRLDLLAGAVTDVGAVAAPGTPAYAADAALVAALAETGARPEHPRATVLETVATPSPDGVPGEDRVEVRVRYVVEAHEQGAAGGASTHVPASGPRAAGLTLLWTDVGWRVSAVA